MRSISRKAPAHGGTRLTAERRYDQHGMLYYGFTALPLSMGGVLVGRLGRCFRRCARLASLARGKFSAIQVAVVLWDES